MTLLTVLTLIYAVVLVAALAASLIAILVYLRRIAAVLGEAREALAAVDRETEPLASQIQPLHDAVAGSAQEIETTKTQLAHADEHLARVLERLGLRERIG